jgi:predicted transposase YbfD/YdcC
MATKTTRTEEKHSILDYFAALPDPRRDNENNRHQLIDIIAISILATICGAEHFTEMEDYGRANQEFLQTFLELPNGIPSHDTFGRVFARMDPHEFKKCFAAWVDSIRDTTDGDVVAIDGKTLRRSHQRSRGKGPLHLVSAWAANNRLTLGQVKVDEKSNEITAVPELLKLLYIKGCIVTIDAMGTQKEIARQIREKGADYVLALKDNQPTLYAEVEGIFIAEEDSLRREKKSKNQVSRSKLYETMEKGHGRRETRRVLSVEAPEWLGKKETWQDLRSLVMVEAKREVNGQTSTERRYFISSLAPDAQRAAEIVRSHWGIENSLHWVLDVAFREDDSRVRAGNAPENLALIRKLTHNLLKHETTLKRGIKTKRLVAAWDRKYLLKILNVKASFD